MVAPAHRPNFLLLWIGILILTMISALRMAFPNASSRKDHSANQSPPAHLAPPAQPVPVSNTLPLGGQNDSLIPLHSGESLLAEADPLHPNLLPGDGASSVTGVGETHGLATPAGGCSKGSARNAKPEMKDGMREAHPQIGPLPDPMQTVRPDLLARESEHRASAPEIFPAPTFVMGFSGLSGANGTQPARSDVPPLPEKILVIRLSPEEYRAFLVFSEQGLGAADEPEAAPQSDPSGDENEGREEEDPASGSGSVGNTGSTGSWARFAAGWAESHRPPRPPSPDEMRRLAEMLRRTAAEQPAARRQIAVLDLGPREAARLIDDLLRMAASR